jgi:poly-beta-hydroxybutyrate-responsive repressor
VTVVRIEVRGLLNPFLLLLLRERSGHGYDLLERLAGLGIQGVEPSHCYRVLRSLEAGGLVVSSWTPGGAGPARRCYDLTSAGWNALETCTERLAELNRLTGRYLERSAPIRDEGPAQRPAAELAQLTRA